MKKHLIFISLNGRRFAINIMKNNIIDMTSTATFAVPCSFREIFHYIIAHLGFYFVDNSTNILFEFLNWLRSISLKLYPSRNPKEKSLEVLNRIILAANCNCRHTTGVSWSLPVFPIKKTLNSQGNLNKILFKVLTIGFYTFCPSFRQIMDTILKKLFLF